MVRGSLLSWIHDFLHLPIFEDTTEMQMFIPFIRNKPIPKQAFGRASESFTQRMINRFMTKTNL